MNHAQTPTRDNTFFFCSCGEWFLVFKEEHQLEISENKVLRKQLSNLNLGCYAYMTRNRAIKQVTSYCWRGYDVGWVGDT
jgi:hypothetical protein